MGSGRDTAFGWLEMGYLKPQALENLKKYAYKGVDKQVLILSDGRSSSLTDTKVLAFETRLEPILELARNFVAEMGRS